MIAEPRSSHALWVLRPGGERHAIAATERKNEIPSPDLNCHVTLPVGVHATEGTISYLDMLRCGISNRPMSARDQTRALRARLVRVRFRSMSRPSAESAHASHQYAEGFGCAVP